MSSESPPSPQIPSEVIYSILLRLPVKSLKRFSCVCKPWLSLISSPQFQKDHSRQGNPLLLTLQSNCYLFDESKVPDLTLRFSVYDNDGTLIKKFSKSVEEPYFNSSIVGKPFVLSCQGLVCMGRFGAMLICNPSREEVLPLPPSDHHYCFGFGYAASSEEYKVVRFFRNTHSGSSECEVFTLGTSKWRKAKTPPPFYVGNGTAPFLRGSVHILRDIGFGRVDDSDYIAAFDIETEVYKEIPLPAYYYTLGDCGSRLHIVNKSNFMRLSTLGGELCLTFDFGELDERLELWIMKDYEKARWVKGYTINVSSVYPYPSYMFRAFPTDNMGREKIWLSCADQEGVKVLCYDTEGGVITQQKDKEWGATLYTESFFSLAGLA